MENAMETGAICGLKKRITMNYLEHLYFHIDILHTHFYVDIFRLTLRWAALDI